MKLTFFGAAKTVTGSCYLVETERCRFLVDCGMFQGQMKEDMLNEEVLPVNPAELDYVILTHAHIDHSGRIPKIYLDGFNGQVITTKATAELCGIMLPDSGHIQETESEWINRKRKRAGKPEIKPLYTYQDAVDCMKLFKGCKYDEIIQLKGDVRIRFNDAGHMLGSSIVEIWISEGKREIKVVFSGDLGNKGIPILRDPSIIESADYLIIESTYGNRIHRDTLNKIGRFVDIINETLDKGGNVIIPSFAVGRTQEIIYELHKQLDVNGEKLRKFLSIPVYIDSPLAVSATEVFRRNLDCFDDEARVYIENGDNPLDFPGLQFTRTSEESKALNEKSGSKIIISASGMCEAGRIKHHLKHNLWHRESSVIFVGYQAEGTLGRSLVDGAKRVKLFGEEITVNARIEMIDGFSGHADRDGLLEWIEKFQKKPEKIFIVHGEEQTALDFSKLVSERFDIETVVPERNDSFVIGAVKEIEGVLRAKPDFTFKRLEIIQLLETLREEFNEMTELMKNELKKDKDEPEVEKLKAQLVNLERTITRVAR